jgi:hypothetical protein
MTEPYLPPFSGGRWAISRTISGRRVYLVERSPLDYEEDIAVILAALGLPADEYMDYFFPRNEAHERCPTLELLERVSVIGREGYSFTTPTGV